MSYKICSYCCPADVSRVAGAAIILGTKVVGDHPSDAFINRTEHGIELYETGQIAKLIFTGGQKCRYLCPEAIAAYNYALSKNVPTADMLIEDGSLFTRETQYFAAEQARTYGLNSFIIVSDRLHMRRAMSMAHELAIPAWASAAPDLFGKSMMRKVSFLAHEVIASSGYGFRRLANGLV